MMMKRIGELEHIMANLIQENKGLDERLDSHGARLYTLEQLGIPHQVSKAVNEVVRDAVVWAMQAPLRNRFRDLPKADMKEIFHQRIWIIESYESHKDHMKLYEALEKSMNHDHSKELAKDLAEARKKKKKSRESPKTPHGSLPHQPPPPPPPAGPSGASGASGSSQVPPPPPLPSSTNQESQSKGSTAPSSSKTVASAEYQAWMTTDIRLRPSISLTPADLQMDKDMAPDEQAQLSNDEDIRSAHIPKTGDIAMFMDWFCKRQGITELKPQDVEGPAFEIIKVFHPDVIHLQYQMEECHNLLTDSVDDSILRHNFSKPLPLGGLPGQVTIQSDFFFNKDLEYLRYGSKGSRPALSGDLEYLRYGSKGSRPALSGGSKDNDSTLIDTHLKSEWELFGGFGACVAQSRKKEEESRLVFFTEFEYSLMLTISSTSKVSSLMSFSKFFFSVTLIASSSSKSSSTNGDVLDGGRISSNATLSDSLIFMPINTISSEESKVKAQREKSSEAPPITAPIPLVSSAVIVHPLEGKASEEKPSEEEPPSITNQVPPDLKALVVHALEEKNSGEKALEEESPSKRLKLANLKAKKEKIEEKLKKLTPSDIQVQAKKLAEFNFERKRMFEEYNHYITFRADPLDPQGSLVKEDIMVDGMHRNTVPPLRVEVSRGLVIRELESGIFFYNGNFDLVFQKEEEFHLAITAKLIRTQSDIQKGAPKAEEMFKKIKLTTEARNDESSGIEGLAECKASTSNLRRIQVKDIIKEVEDYLNTYLLAGMDISWIFGASQLPPTKPLDEVDDVVVLENNETKEEDVEEDESDHNKERYTFEDDDDDEDFDDLD
nr:hypothetical protein [Tanacetum cinerariifolium]